MLPYQVFYYKVITTFVYLTGASHEAVINHGNDNCKIRPYSDLMFLTTSQDRARPGKKKNNNTTDVF